MAASTTFESRLQPGSPLKVLWNEVCPHFYGGKITSREEAYILFSRVLKITHATRELDDINGLWLETLALGSFSLCPEGEEPQEYNFNTIIDLIKSGKQGFDVEVEEVEPETNNLREAAEAVHAICLSALGDPPPVDYFLQKLKSTDTFCLLAKHEKTYIACAYGTLIPFSRGNIFHCNILGRKISYPSTHILEKFGEQLNRIFQRFSQIDYFTLLVELDNCRMIEPYEKQGFRTTGKAEKGPKGTSVYFYLKKADPNSEIEPPSFEEFSEAREKLQPKKN